MLQLKRPTALVFALLALALGSGGFSRPAFWVRGSDMCQFWPFLGPVGTVTPLVSYVTFAFLFLAGVVLGLLDPSRSTAWAMLTCVSVAVLAVLEAILGLHRHSLWPIELGVYAVHGLISVVGMRAGRLVRFRIRPER